MDKDTIKMSKRELRGEHKKLLKILRTGSRKKQRQEARDQAREMKRYR